jgi:hypothetical protein
MKTIQISADVYSTTEDVSYRIYVDNDLMTERTFKWPHRKYYIEEHLVIKAEKGTTHTIRVESAKESNVFSLRNIIVDGVKTGETFIV